MYIIIIISRWGICCLVCMMYTVRNQQVNSLHSYQNCYNYYYHHIFNIGKPLEVSLVEIENEASQCKHEKIDGNSAVGVLEGASFESKSNSDVVTQLQPLSSLTSSSKSSSSVIINGGDWRLPQRSNTSYVRCILEVFYFMLRKRKVSILQAKYIHLALCFELVKMMENDLHFMWPNSNGVLVCNLAIKELSRTAVKLVEEYDVHNSSYLSSTTSSKVAVASSSEDSTLLDKSMVLDEIYSLVKTADETLDLCRSDELELIPILDLQAPLKPLSSSSTTTVKENPHEPLFTQFADHPVWDIENNDIDPGQAVALQKYIPVDLLLIPSNVTTRLQAITAIRVCDRQCSLIENQTHCIKNKKFLIAAAIEHTFTHVSLSSLLSHTSLTLLYIIIIMIETMMLYYDRRNEINNDF